MRYSYCKQFPCETLKVFSLNALKLHKTAQETFTLQKLQEVLFTKLPNIVHSMGYALQSSPKLFQTQSSTIMVMRWFLNHACTRCGVGMNRQGSERWWHQAACNQGHRYHATPLHMPRGRWGQAWRKNSRLQDYGPARI